MLERELAYGSAVCRSRFRYGRACLRQLGVDQRDGPFDDALSGDREQPGNIISPGRWLINDLRDGIARLLLERHLTCVMDYLHV
jgi:hypothetical protein